MQVFNHFRKKLRHRCLTSFWIHLWYLIGFTNFLFLLNHFLAFFVLRLISLLSGGEQLYKPLCITNLDACLCLLCIVSAGLCVCLWCIINARLSGVGIPGDKSMMLCSRRFFPLPSSFVFTLVRGTESF